MAWTEKYVTVAGAGAHDGTSEANAWTLAEAIAAYAAGQRINVKAGTYANTTTDRTLGTSGTTTSPIWWRGYNTTIGDIDANNALTKPAVTFTTGRLSVSGSHQIISNLDISGAQVTNGQVRIFTGTFIHFDRCRVECTAANANGRAVSINTTDVTLSRCWLKCTSSVEIVDTSGQNRLAFLGCALEGGANGIVHSGTSNILIAFCSFNNVGGDAIQSSMTAAWLIVLCNTFYSAGSDSIEMTALPGNGIIAGNLFSESAGWNIKNSSGANTNLIRRLHNLTHTPTSGHETGFGDSPSLAEQTDTSSPFANAAGADLALVATTTAKATNIPVGFENQSYTSYYDIGAVQRQELPAGNRLITVTNIGTY